MNEITMNKQRQDERAKWGSAPRVRFLEMFFDGNLIPEFQRIQQNPRVERGEIRQLPRELLERVIQSGAVVEAVFYDRL